MKKVIILITLVTVGVGCNNSNDVIIESDLNDSLPSFVPDTDGECCEVEGDYIQAFDSLPYSEDSIAVNF